MSVMQSGDIAVHPEGPTSILASRWRRIAFVGVAATGLALTLAWLSTPLYRGEASLLVNARASGSAADRDYASGQIELIRSADILEKVATRLDLADLPEFDAAAQPSVASQALIIVGLKRDPSETPAADRVLDVLREKLNVYGAERARVIVIEFSSSDPRLAAAIPNAIADAYVAERPGAAQQPDTAAPVSAASDDGLKQAEARLADFRAGLVTATDDGSAAVVADELAQARAERRASETMAQSLRDVINGGSIDALPEDAALGGLQSLREQQVQLKADIAELSITLLDNHPRLRGVRAQLADIEAQIAAEARAALTSLTTATEASQTREAELSAELNRLQAASARTAGQEAELRALEREVELQRESLASSPASVPPAVGNNYVAADARIFARAIEPSEPYFPKFGPIAAVAFAGSIALMTALTLLGGLFSGRRKPATSSARPEPIPLIAMPAAHETLDEQPSDGVFALYGEGTEPEAANEDVESEQVVASEDELEPALPESDEAISMLGEIGIETTAERLIASGATRAIFVSPEGDEAAAAAVLVAREIADSGLRVLLLDLTASGAASRPMLDSVSYPGITNLMAAEAQFTDVIHSDHYSDCHVMPVGTADPARAMRAADRLPIIMESLTTAYDLVVVECGPAGPEAIRRLVAPGAAILLSLIDPNEDIAEAADALVASGYDELTLVTPVGFRSQNAPMAGRSAA